jgi:hypothetical protein
VAVKHRGFKQMSKGPRTIEFSNGDSVDFEQYPAFTTKGVVASADLRGDVSGRAVLKMNCADGRHFIAYINFGPIAGATSKLYTRLDAVYGHVVPSEDHSGPLSSHGSDHGRVEATGAPLSATGSTGGGEASGSGRGCSLLGRCAL